MIAGDAEHAIAAREATGSYRVLQRLLPCVHSELRALSGLRLGLFLDTETTRSPT